jgi:hypothetical protein
MFHRLHWRKYHSSFLLLDRFEFRPTLPDLPEHLNIPRYRCDKLKLLLNIETSLTKLKYLYDCSALSCRKSPLATWLLYCATDVSEYIYHPHSILTHPECQSPDTIGVTADYNLLHVTSREGYKWLSTLNDILQEWQSKTTKTLVMISRHLLGFWAAYLGNAQTRRQFSGDICVQRQVAKSWVSMKEFTYLSKWTNYIVHTQPTVRWVWGHLPGGKATRAWRWPPTPSSFKVKERV